MPEKIWISIGGSRTETNWKNKQLSWPELAERLRKFKVTSETYAEYVKLEKSKRDEIKDVGGFVGGTIIGGRRKLNSCNARYLLTLDVDYGTSTFWEDYQMYYGNEAVLYSTHHHSHKHPRLRLVIPLTREVLPDEYEAVARKIAGNLGINLFDPTTFQPERLMYWPSRSVDGDEVFEWGKGEWTNPDAIMAEYVDWRDITQWPISESSKIKLHDAAIKQEDPALKGGVVGVFCRCYGIKEAIEHYLSEIYEETIHEDRYTYREGSTSGGLVVYDNKFAFSHHSTDPISGRMCNSFDLVRIHLFGESDDRVEEGTPTNKKPSYDKMVELATQSEQVRKDIVQGKVNKRQEVRNKAPVEGDWMQALEMDRKGNVLNTINNIVIILNNDEQLKDSLGYDDLRKIPVVLRDLPWRSIGRYTNSLTDADDSALRNHIELLYGISSKDKLKDAMEIVIRDNTFHPVKDYLASCVWDRKERLERLFVDYLGAEDNSYTREVTLKTLVAAVARVYQPGVKFDNVLVLVGRQGLGKSRLIGRLGGEWFSDTFGNLQNKDAMEQIQGVWIMELGELAGLKRQEVETVKLFVAKREDRFRVAYARRVETFARQCIFIGSTNNEDFLQDATGNRRFWPIKCGLWESPLIGREMDEGTRAQIWAEACYRYTMGEELYLTAELEAKAKEVQELHSEQWEMKQHLIDYLSLKVPPNWITMQYYERLDWINGTADFKPADSELMQRNLITVPEIWTELLKGQVKDLNRVTAKPIRDTMNKMKGWVPYCFNRKPHGTQRGWVREGSSEFYEFNINAVQPKN